MLHGSGRGRGLRAVLMLGWLAMSPGIGRAQDEGGAAEEPTRPFTLGADLDVVTDYVFRGALLNDSISFQPRVWAAAYGFNVSLWFQLASEPISGSDRTTEEIDFALAYGTSFDKFSLGAGYIRYIYPDSDVDSTNEIYLTAAYDHWLGPNAGVYYDWNVESFYLEGGIGPKYSLGEKIVVSPKLTAALYTFSGDELQDLNRVEPWVTVDYAIGGGFSATGHAHYVIPISDEAEDFFENKFYAGVALHYTF